MYMRKWRVTCHCFNWKILQTVFCFLKEYLSSTHNVDCTRYRKRKGINIFRIVNFHLLLWCLILFKHKPPWSCCPFIYINLVWILTGQVSILFGLRSFTQDKYQSQIPFNAWKDRILNNSIWYLRVGFFKKIQD